MSINNGNFRHLRLRPLSSLWVTLLLFLLFATHIKTTSTEEESHFLTPSSLRPGQFAPVIWKSDKKVVDEEMLLIGLPPELTTVLRDYLDESGILKLLKTILYEAPLKPGENRIYTANDQSKWSAMHSEHWKTTDLTWFESANEETYELTLRLLKEGNFDVVLDAIGREFELDGLMVHGAGVIAVSQFSGDSMHVDLKDTDSDFYNIIFPLHIPSSGQAPLYLGDDEDGDRIESMNLRPDVGIVLGGNSYHGTGECNYRESGEFRVSMAIYVADINEDNVEIIAADTTSLFPMESDAEWFLSQQGRVWNTKGNSLKRDKGRKPYHVQDDPNLDCPSLASRGECERDLEYEGVRARCLKSCKVYMEDDKYYAQLFPDAQREEL